LSVLLNQELSLDRSRYLPPPGESGPEG
jgi:hypothetical protein